jgi:hypothetical protein
MIKNSLKTILIKKIDENSSGNSKLFTAFKQNFKKLTKNFFAHSRNSQNFFFATKKIHLQFQHNFFSNNFLLNFFLITLFYFSNKTVF